MKFFNIFCFQKEYCNYFNANEFYLSLHYLAVISIAIQRDPGLAEIDIFPLTFKNLDFSSL